MPGPTVLERFAYDPKTLERLVRRYLAGELNKDSQRLEQAPEAIGSTDADAPRELGQLSAEARHALAEGGRQALRAGRVALLCMAGGMATRFGGGAKACARLRDEGEASFLSWSCQQVARLEAQLDARIPWVVMTSFATDAAIAEVQTLLEERPDDPDLRRWLTDTESLKQRVLVSALHLPEGS
mgnify:CR=1 FL=1